VSSAHSTLSGFCRGRRDQLDHHRPAGERLGPPDLRYGSRRLDARALHALSAWQLGEIDRIIARSNWPPQRPSTVFRILALLTGDIAAGRPFPPQIEIARRRHRHESLVRKNLRAPGKLGYTFS